MAQLTVDIPGEVVDGLRQALLEAHAERLAVLRRAVDAYAASHERLDDVQGAVVEVADLHEVLEQLGWTPAPARRAVRLTAHPEVLADALQAMLARQGPEPHVLELARRVEREGDR
jgi:hypothetical protein